MIEDVISGIVYLFSCSYGVLLILLYIRFRNLKTDVPESAVHSSVTVVVAARNEEHTIVPLLNALEQQQCDFSFDVIIVDDHSTDRTVHAIQAHWAKQISVRVISNGGAGKKDAITTGVHATASDVILLTDADCIPDPQWVQKMSEPFNDPQCVFVGGMIRPNDADGPIEKALETETIFLQVASAGMYAMGNPSMCNGASMGFARRLFLEVNGFTNDLFVSGDDMLLLQKAKWLYPSGIRWVKHKNAMVETRVEGTLAGSVAQRARWLSKIRAYTGPMVNVTGLLFLFMQLQFPLAIAGSMIIGFEDNPFWIGTVLKVIVELLLLSLAASYFRVTNALLMFPASFVMYSVISIGAVFRMMKGNIVWKGRTWRNGRVR